MTDTLNIRIGKATSAVLIPVSDNVLTKLIVVKENRFDPNRIDYGWQIIDFDYDEMDDDTNDVIQQLAQDEYIHWETANIVLDDNGDLKKSSKLYKMLKSMNNGKDIEEGENVNLKAHEGKNFRIDFEHVERKGGPPDFKVIAGEYKNSLAKIRPERRPRAEAKAAPARTPEPVQAEIPAADSDLYDDDDVEETA